MIDQQEKDCGHFCVPSSTSLCCTCSDLRPVQSENTYPCYIDGIGWQNTASRNSYYCHVCNPKNYSVWKAKIEKQHIEKVHQQEMAFEILKKDQEQLLVDHIRAASVCADDVTVEFMYKNGDIYVGQMRNGRRWGSGKMLFCDGSAYEGQWHDDMMHGHGIRNWLDGIFYVGDWKRNAMNGNGRYTMVDGSVMEGMFEDDTFVG